MKKFFQGIKSDIKFKSAGPGHSLTEETREKGHNEKSAKETHRPLPAPSEGAQMAATAALARIELQQAKSKLPSSHDLIRTKVKKELEAEAAAALQPQTSSFNESYETAAKSDSAVFSVSGVFFTCPLTGATLRKNQRDAHIREAILLYFSEDPISASIMKVHTFNRDSEKVKLGIETIAKYLENIHKNPQEEKYRKIRMSNRVFQERISGLEGAQEFFQAIGFEKKMLPVPGQDIEEEFFVLKEDILGKVEDLEQYRENLLSAEPVKAMLDRSLQVFQSSNQAQAAQFELPDDFYNLSAVELEREQRLKTEATERNSMLRTKAMREKEEKREMRKYNYTLLRVRLPDGHILQGTFYARERISALMEFIRAALENDWLPFELLGPGGQKLEDENIAFNECGLVPAALLTFQWDSTVMKDIEAAGSQNRLNILKPELLSDVHFLS